MAADWLPTVRALEESARSWITLDLIRQEDCNIELWQTVNETTCKVNLKSIPSATCVSFERN